MSVVITVVKIRVFPKMPNHYFKLQIDNEDTMILTAWELITADVMIEKKIIALVMLI